MTNGIVRIYQLFEMILLKVGFFKSYSASQLILTQHIGNYYKDRNKNGQCHPFQFLCLSFNQDITLFRTGWETRANVSTVPVAYALFCLPFWWYYFCSCNNGFLKNKTPKIFQHSMSCRRFLMREYSPNIAILMLPVAFPPNSVACWWHIVRITVASAAAFAALLMLVPASVFSVLCTKMNVGVRSSEHQVISLLHIREHVDTSCFYSVTEMEFRNALSFFSFAQMPLRKSAPDIFSYNDHS